MAWKIHIQSYIPTKYAKFWIWAPFLNKIPKMYYYGPSITHKDEQLQKKKKDLKFPPFGPLSCKME